MKYNIKNEKIKTKRSTFINLKIVKIITSSMNILAAIPERNTRTNLFKSLPWENKMIRKAEITLVEAKNPAITRLFIWMGL